ncbi:ABC transporter permease [Streptomyces acidiscabies]|uniref:ABC transporter permease subunit n=1 Tax=Streptomyces acidiscabies TaxID=42234 RepID=A0AAP6B8L7_9ACTN|nr:ABC transporter permease subunit [Streptomyces acidiscabies]MBP5936261.1 sugar ABC transporter permease [Streptomyces sp. LBUM 1476]MBZ3915788.1 sugar ABC transporter permease [Streptomyces acidiscabies]MDX2960194.1 ABC transporter permease subunit [Streptomyces acidiscabies]MDX3019545.1 ABC transporter permease subunit [Streptomyces acidiscabies]MDX3793354.1 ABC transporter permease subunit [Streptomyces acidiscabies]
MSTPTTSAPPPGTQDPPPPKSPGGTKYPSARRSWRRALRRDWQLYSLVVLPLLFFLVFRYLPMIGNVIAFRRFEPGGSILGEQWVGLRYVRMFLSDPTFWQVFRNTLWLGLLTLVFCFPIPIVLALLLNEVRRTALKRFVQSVSYLPHFLSVVIVAGITMQMLATDGPVNHVLGWLGHDPIRFIQEPEWFRTVYVGSEVWQTAGWGTILYLAALTTIDDDLYEAARIDGANRWRQIWHVTLPGIRPTMITLLILNIGTFMAVGFEKILLLYNPLTYPTADVVSTYLYRAGVESNSFSYAAAIGLFEAVIGLVLITSANQLSRRTVGTSLW